MKLDELLIEEDRTVLEAMRRDSGMPLSILRVDGGASANNMLMQFQSDILSLPVELQMRLHQQNEEIYGILAGKGKAVIDGEEIALTAGDWLKVAPAAKRQFSAAADRPLFTTAFWATWLARSAAKAVLKLLSMLSEMLVFMKCAPFLLFLHMIPQNSFLRNSRRKKIALFCIRPARIPV